VGWTPPVASARRGLPGDTPPRPGPDPQDPRRQLPGPARPGAEAGSVEVPSRSGMAGW